MAKKNKSMKNVKAIKKENCVEIKVNPKVYPLPIVYQAADVFIDRCWVFLDGDPEKEIKVILQPKKRSSLGKLVGEFNNELLNYAALTTRVLVNKELREMIVKRAFFSVSKEEEKKEEKFEEKLAEKEKIDIGARVPIVDTSKKSEEIEKEFDIEEIAKPWEEQKGAIKEKPKKLLSRIKKSKG